MRAINHALTGAIIGFAVSEPIMALPAAVASHYICDAIPHFGAGLPNAQELRSKLFRDLLYIDALLCVGLVMILAGLKPMHWPLAVLCAFAAAAPDFLSFNRYVHTLQHRKWRGNAYSNFASSIQWFERPVGAAVEVAWFIGATILLLPFLR
jgi:hypothetical protein